MAGTGVPPSSWCTTSDAPPRPLTKKSTTNNGANDGVNDGDDDDNDDDSFQELRSKVEQEQNLSLKVQEGIEEAKSLMSPKRKKGTPEEQVHRQKRVVTSNNFRSAIEGYEFPVTNKCIQTPITKISVNITADGVIAQPMATHYVDKSLNENRMKVKYLDCFQRIFGKNVEANKLSTDKYKTQESSTQKSPDTI